MPTIYNISWNSVIRFFEIYKDHMPILSFSKCFSCIILNAKIDSVVDFPCWNPYWVLLIYMICLSLSSTSHLYSFIPWHINFIPMWLLHSVTLPFPLYKGVNMLVLQTAGIPFLGHRSFGHKSALGLSYLLISNFMLVLHRDYMLCYSAFS